MRVPKPMLTEFGIHRRFESRENHLTKWVLLDIFFISQPQSKAVIFLLHKMDFCNLRSTTSRQGNSRIIHDLQVRNKKERIK